MKFEKNREYFIMSIYVLVTFGILIVFNHAIGKFTGLYNVFMTIIKILMPIFYGFMFAYLLNPILAKSESILFKKTKLKKNMVRGMSLALTYLIAFLFIYIFILIVIPQLVDSVKNLVNMAPSMIEQGTLFLDGIIERFGLPIESLNDQYGSFINDGNLLSNILPFLNDLLPQIASITSAIASSMADLVVGLIVSVYVLIQKEKFFAQAKKILFAIFKAKTARKIIRVGNYSSKTFNGFLLGSILDSLLVGVVCFIGMSIFRFPYALLISVIIGVTNIIPFFGPFFGGIPSFLLILLIDPIKALWFGIFIIVLQQVDGNIIAPRILGEHTGLSSFWVIFAILVAGGLFGFFGMVVGVPVFAIIYTMIRVLVDNKLKKRGLPSNTSDYAGPENPKLNTEGEEQACSDM